MPFTRLLLCVAVAGLLTPAWAGCPPDWFCQKYPHEPGCGDPPHRPPDSVCKMNPDARGCKSPPTPPPSVCERQPDLPGCPKPGVKVTLSAQAKAMLDQHRITLDNGVLLRSEPRLRHDLACGRGALRVVVYAIEKDTLAYRWYLSGTHEDHKIVLPRAPGGDVTISPLFGHEGDGLFPPYP